MKWTRDWPTTEGRWWFFGWKFGQHKPPLPPIKPDFHLVQSRRCGDGSLAFTGDGHFWYPQEGADGWWTKAELPEKPSE